MRFYDESVRLYQDLSNEFDFNILYSQRGHFTLAHTDAALRTARWRAEVNKHLGVNSSVAYPDDIARICPQLNLGQDVRFPILGALYHPPGSIARHDAVAWGYGRGAAERGVEIHQQTEVTGLQTEQAGRVTGVHGPAPRRHQLPAGCSRPLRGRARCSRDMAGFAAADPLPCRCRPA